MATIYARDLKIGDKVVRAGGVKFGRPQTVSDVSRGVISDRIYIDFESHSGSIEDGDGFYVRGLLSSVEIL